MPMPMAMVLDIISGMSRLLRPVPCLAASELASCSAVTMVTQSCYEYDDPDFFQ